MSVGRFDTITRTKITTPYGIILKVTRYEEDSNPDVEYKVRPNCYYCKEPLDCYCLNDNDYDDDYENAFEEATELLQLGLVCDNPHCIIKQGLDSNPDTTNALILKYGEDVWSIADAIQESWPEWDECPEMCGV